LKRFLELLPAGFEPPAGPVAVGWSGGADSTALLLALKAAGCAVHAWHVDHAWRDESAAEAELLARRAVAWGIPFDAARVASPSGRNREAEARRLRYEQFIRWGGQQGVRQLFLAHHAEDQAETVFLRLLQGAGVGGCRGMQSGRELHGLLVRRPLLAVRRSEIEECLCQTGVEWLEDASNQDLTLKRNHIRYMVFPSMQAAGVDPVQLFDRWSRQAVRLADTLQEEVDRVAMAEGNDDVRLPWDAWQASAPAVRARLLQMMAGRLFGDGVTPGRRHILLAESWTRAGGTGGLDLSGCRLERCAGSLHLRRSAAILR